MRYYVPTIGRRLKRKGERFPWVTEALWVLGSFYLPPFLFSRIYLLRASDMEKMAGEKLRQGDDGDDKLINGSLLKITLFSAK